MKVMIVVNEDESISIAYPQYSQKDVNESEDEFLFRSFHKMRENNIAFHDRPYYFIDHTELPGREKRYAWRWDEKGKRVYVNESIKYVPTEMEELIAGMKELLRKSANA